MSVYLINPLILYLVVVCLNQLHDTANIKYTKVIKRST